MWSWTEFLRLSWYTWAIALASTKGELKLVVATDVIDVHGQLQVMKSSIDFTGLYTCSSISIKVERTSV